VDHFEHLIPRIDTRNLRQAIEHAIEHAIGKKPSHDDWSWQYIEMQVHGPLELDKDVATLVISENHRGTKYDTKLRTLARQNGLSISWWSDKGVRPDRSSKKS
jgi:hypothetical protein